ncbi:hypothetical protein C8A00DRAFT_47108 [Chaetomidium leptoderma]|uniref:Uncharacterized protein n=1 Tax=Chaetomidium leptoderma TaxID=669021 RepID=A0AAN6VD26_9PEZI|nr:hypothetical protein C8A00DRAFT_47108 [Chaetomidium leptoderma]
MDSNISNDSMASSATATSTRPLNPVQRQNTTGFSSKPGRQNSDPREKGSPGGGGYYGGGDAGSAQTPYMNMLLSLDRIPRLHNILVSFFVWILLAGFVIIPGSFTSPQRKQEGETVEIPGVGSGGSGGSDGAASKLALTPANTAAVVIGFVCIVAGTFGSAWLALRWRRNYIWLLNKLYMPLILDALAGLLAAVTSVYAQQVGHWSPQAITTAIIEAATLVLGGMLFLVYNYWLLQRLRGDHDETVTGGKKEKKGKKGKKGKKEKEKKKEEKKEKKEKKKEHKAKGGWWGRFKRGRKKRPYAAGSIV